MMRAWLGAMLLAAMCSAAIGAEEQGVLPVDEHGRPINTDFETGSLKDWKTTGSAFNAQPIKGDAIAARRPEMHSNHAGNYWIGTFEVGEDGPRGTLESVPFKVTHPWAKFLIGGGSIDEAVDIVLADDNKVFFTISGENNEDMKPVAVDLHEIMGKKIFIRVHDDHSFSWGHVNFDDFKFYEKEPNVPKRTAINPDQVKFAGLSPEEAAKAMTLPEGFKATLFAGEPDVHQPVGFCIDDRGRLWVAEAYTYPTRAKEGEGKDDILIFEDTNGDGKFDKRTVFTTGLNLVSGIEVGFGGVWVGAAPYLLFIPDKDHDDKPDGEPQILLDGWAYQDTHETLNGFIWGPDGWLYGCHGVFTHSRVGKPGTPDDKRVPINAGIWRYHPQKNVFEVFAEGTSNPWGVDFNDMGQAFCTACVIPHLYHIIQGAHYQRQAGSHFNPNVYRDRDIQNIGDHVHWVGDKGPHAGNNSSASAGGGHAHCGAMLYLGGAWPDKYRDTIFMANIHGNRLNNDILEQVGSGYVGHHGADPVLMNDKWSRPINFKYGPDGNVFMIDWYDRNACHNPISEIWDRTNGRIYKLSYENSEADRAKAGIDLTKFSNEDLVKCQLNKNDWFVRHARRILQERNAGAEVRDGLVKILNDNPDPTRKLRALWALYCSGGMTKEILASQVKAENPYVRAWAIQLAAENILPMNLTGPFIQIIRTGVIRDHDVIPTDDESPVVRLYLASALQRFPVDSRWSTLEKLVAHSEDATDHNLPLMYWFAAEPAVGFDFAKGIALAKTSQIPLLREFISRRIASLAIEGGEKSRVKVEPLSALAKLLIEIDDAPFQLAVLTGMSDALNSRRSITAPPEWPAVYDKLGKSSNDDIRVRTQSLSVLFGDERALAALRNVVTDTAARLPDRQKAIDGLLGANDQKLPPLLLKLLDDETLRAPALRALASYDSPETPAAIFKIYPKLDQATKVDALNTLASRVPYAEQLKAAVEAGTIPKQDVSAATLRQLFSLENDSIRDWLGKTFGSVRSTPESKLKEIAMFKSLLTDKAMQRADAQNGRAVFAKVCMQCHTLFGAGGKVGPDLTGSNRADAEYVLQNAVDPSAVIGKDYLASLIRLNDNRVLSGIIKSEDDNAINVVTENQTLSIPKSEIKTRKLSNLSMMPEGLIQGLKHSEIRDLVAYLRSPSQVPMLATTQSASTIFNGKDLSNWTSDIEGAWSVDNGEIVGKTSGLKENHFLISQLTVAEFRLTFKVKLVNNVGNSGVQFRSEPFKGNEMKGYQADIGPGWWGKLYEEQARGMLVDNDAEKYARIGEWNEYEILAIGNHITTALNGHKCVDLEDKDGARRGVIALQLHAGGPTEVRFKDLKLEIDPKPEMETVK